MIASRIDLNEYLLEDRKALGFKSRHPSVIGNEIWKFQISLRYLEYYTNCQTLFCGGKRLFWKLINHHYSVKLGFDIPPNTCGKGLNIHHYGCVVIHPNARLGDYCNIQQGVNIGQNYSAENVPMIGCGVYLGPGAKLFGKIEIANGTVTKSFLTPNRTIVGNPARDIGERKPGLV